jgi:glycosyltransferase involved in cell wall biosynthesis
VVGNGPDLAIFRPVPGSDGYRRGRRNLVGYVGVMGDQDGVDYLIRAVAHIVHARRHRDTHFVCIGGGPALDDLRQLARDLDVDEFVEFPGLLYGERLVECLSSADVCVDPEPINGYSEFCSTNKVLEYMALGKPVVQFDRLEGRRCAREAAVYARANDEAALGDEILEVLGDHVRREEMARVGLARMRDQLSWRWQRQHLSAAYAAVLVGARPLAGPGGRANANAASAQSTWVRPVEVK